MTQGNPENMSQTGASSARTNMGSSNAGRRLLIRGMAILFGCVLALGMAETLAALRLVDYRTVFQTLSDEPWQNPVNRLDDELLHVHKPNQKLTGTMPGGDISYYLSIREQTPHAYDVQTDADGFRNTEPSAKANIVVIGDSFVEAMNVPEDQTLAQRLAQLRNQTAVNLGQIWYGPQQELVVLKKYGLPRHPSVVVWCFFEGNDLRDFRRYREAKANWEDLAPTFHSFARRSFSRNVALRILGMAGPSRNRPDGETNVGFMKSNGERVYFFYTSPPLSAEDEHTLDDVATVIGNAFHLTHEAGAKFLLAIVPIKYRVYQRACDFPEDSVCRTWKLGDLPQRMRQMADTISPELLFVDLTSALAAATEKGIQTYFPDDTHWTAEGNRVAAEAIQQTLAGSATNPQP